MKPIEAVDAVIEKIKFPCIIQPKIDGVRAVYLEKFSARSLKPFANTYIQAKYSKEKFKGLDGEMCASNERDPDLCRITTSALNTIDGEPLTRWVVFDYVTALIWNRPYSERLSLANKLVLELMRPDITIITSVACENLDQFLMQEKAWLMQGYEGVIIRDPNGPYKFGRSTVAEGILLRVKRFSEGQARVIGFVEAQENQNEPVINEKGYMSRSSHKENKVGNGKVGSLLAKDIETEMIITVGAGTLSHHNRRIIFENQHLYLGRLFEYKYFSKGVKEKPRFPTFVKWLDFPRT